MYEKVAELGIKKTETINYYLCFLT